MNQRWVNPVILIVLLAARLAGQSSGSTAQFIKADTTTQGSWKGIYGADGYNVIDDTTSYPGYATVSPSGASDYVWSSSTSDVRALQKAASSSDRIASTWYSGGSFTVDVNLTDSATHEVALYFLDWDGGRAQTVAVLDAATNTVLDSRNLTNFYNGEYLVWNLSGHVIISFTQTGSYNAVVSGLFFDPPATAIAPSFSPVAGTYASAQTVTLTTATPGASIRYTTDGSTPSETAGTVYSGPIAVNSTTTIKAIAYATGMPDSPVTSAAYTITSVWYDASWGDRKSLQIDHTKVSGSSSLTSFPMLVSLTDANLATVANGGGVGLSDGSDILFTASDGLTKLAHEIESYNPSTGQVVAWVNLAELSPLGDTVIYIYYGNPAATNQQNPSAVWDSNYGGVWHLGSSGGTLSTLDSTSNSNNATIVGAASAVVGQVGGGASLSGSPNYLDAGNNASVLPTHTGTLSTWVMYNAFGDWATPIGNGNIASDTSGAMIWSRSSGQLDFEVDGTGGRYNTAGGALSTGQWYHVVGAWDGSTVRLYTNGVLTSSVAQGGDANPAYHLNLGVDGGLSGSGSYLNGVLDEARVSSIARSADWIKTEYNNESSPSTFYSVGSQQGSGQVGTPAFSPGAGTFTSSQTIAISTATSGAAIRYTTDGSTPSETAGTLYSSQVTVSSTTTIKAVAYASGMTDSSIASATYTINLVAATPTFNPTAGTFSSAQTVTISTATSGASIRYTTDGSTPSETAGTLYSGPVTVSGTTTIKAIAYASGMTDSSVASASYTISSVVGTPTFSPAAGTYSSTQSVSISTATSGASIRYTTDGSTPSETAGTLYSGPVAVSSTATVKAIAYSSGMTDSSIATANYVISGGSPNSAQFVKTDTATQGSWKGVYGGDGYNVFDDTTAYPSYVTITPSGQGNYIWNGSTSDVRALEKAASPTDRLAATWYSSGSFTIDVNFSDSATHQLAIYCLDWDPLGRTESIAIQDGATNAVLDTRAVSNFGSGQYLVWNLSGHVVVSITNTGSPNAVISGLFFDVAGAIAPPWFTPAAGVYGSAQSLSLTTMAGASVRYTTDGSTPSETAGTLYSGPISVGSTSTINAIAYISGLNDSSIASASYIINPLPTPWIDQDIGSVGVAGSAGFDSSSSSFTIRGSGTEVFYGPDQFNYLYQSLSGNGVIVARVVSEQNTYQSTKAGVMIRESTDPSAAFTFVSLAPVSGGVYFSERPDGAGPDYNGVFSATAPIWVKLVRLGDTFSGYYSSDGNTWTGAGSSFTVSMAANVLIGLAVVSTNNSALTTAVFDNVNIVAGIGVTVTPATANLTVNQTQQFTATVVGTSNTAVTWSISPTVGTISSSGLYTAPSSISSQQTVTLTATSVADTTKSATAAITLTPTTVATPIFSPAAGSYSSTQTVTISTTTSGASIRYTTDGSTPSETAGTLYSGPITVSTTTTIKAIAYESGMTDSSIATATYTISTASVATPTISPAAGTYTSVLSVTISTSTSGASIRYTTDGSTPSETAGTLYSGPVAVSATTTINAIAYANGMADSSISTATYTLNILPPSITSLSLTSGSVGTAVTITGANFGPSQGSSTVTFNGASASAVSSWSNSSVTVAVPSGASTGNVVVTVGGVASNGTSFTVNVSFALTTGVMGSSRSGNTATRLANGNVLVAGGVNTSGVLGSAELYNPASQVFSPASPMNAQRWMHSATLLNDGTVLIAGGSNSTTGTTLNSAEIYDPVAGTFTPLSNTLNTARAGHTATLLNNGQVLLIGGIDPTAGIIQDSELYDPPSQSFIDLGDTTIPRYRHTATLLQSGQVLIAGGETDPIPTGERPLDRRK